MGTISSTTQETRHEGARRGDQGHGRININDLTSHVLPFEQINDASN
jgi:hypothetical protein